MAERKIGLHPIPGVLSPIPTGQHGVKILDPRPHPGPTINAKGYQIFTPEQRKRADLEYEDRMKRREAEDARRTAFFSEDKDFNKRAYDFTKAYTDSPVFEKRMRRWSGDPGKYRSAANRQKRQVDFFNPAVDVEYLAEGEKAAGEQHWSGPGTKGQMITNSYPLSTSKLEVSPHKHGMLPRYRTKPEPHEMGHLSMPPSEHPPTQKAAIMGKMRNLNDPEFRKITGSDPTHNRSPDEARADLHELRFFMHDAGTYDATKPQPFTKEHLDAYRQKTGTHHRLYDKFKDEDIIWMMNNVAMRDDTPPPGMVTGRRLQYA